MNIALFTDTYAPSTGNVPSVVHHLAHCYRAMGHRAVVVCCDPKCKKLETLKGLVRIPGKPAVNQYGYGPAKGRTADQNELFTAMEPYEFQVVHAFTCGTMGTWAMRFSHRYDLPLVYTVSEFYEDAVPYLSRTKLTEGFVGWRQKGRFCDLADNAEILTATNQRATDYLEAAGVKRKLTVVPLCADPDVFCRRSISEDAVNAVTIKHRLEGKITAIFAGRLLYEKAVDVLLQHWAARLKNDERLRLLIVGGGPERRALEALAKELNLSRRVIFTGEVLHKEMPAYFAACDLFVSASETPLMSMAVQEAQLLGLPCILSRKGQAAGQVNEGKNGFYFRGAEELSEYVRQIALLDHDGKQSLKRVVRSTVERIPSFSQAEALLTLYKKANRMHYYDPNRLKAAEQKKKSTGNL